MLREEERITREGRDVEELDGRGDEGWRGERGAEGKTVGRRIRRSRGRRRDRVE